MNIDTTKFMVRATLLIIFLYWVNIKVENYSNQVNWEFERAKNYPPIVHLGFAHIGTVDPSSYLISTTGVDSTFKVRSPISFFSGDVKIYGKLTVRGYEIIPQIPTTPEPFMQINPREYYK